MSCNNPAIQIDDLGKCYHIYRSPQDRFLQFFSARGRKRYREFWALRGVSFCVRRGETVGIVGRNGSGKSTLLQIIAGILDASEGRVTSHGRIAALLELGSGFNPDFSGRENVIMNASVLGLSREEIEACYDDIVAFADIGDFIDQPVKTYSSGMAIRLAFAVQAQIEPDILIVDEALSVGDARFQAKCFERLRRLRERGTCILLVTHSGEQVVTHCDRALLLDAGQVREIGTPRTVVNRYMDLLFGDPVQSQQLDRASQPIAETTSVPVADQPGADPSELSRTTSLFATRPGYNTHEYRWGDRAATLLDYQFRANGILFPKVIEVGQTIEFAFSIHFDRTLIRPILGFTVKTKEGVTVYGINTETQPDCVLAEQGLSGSTILVRVAGYCRLAPGDYFVSVGVATRSADTIVPHDRRYDAIHLSVFPCERFFGLVDLDMKLSVDKSDR